MAGDGRIRKVKSLKEIAKREGVDTSYVRRMVNLTILASRILAAMLEEMPPLEVTLLDLAVDPPAVWGAAESN